MINYAKSRKSKKTPNRAAMMRAEAKETPAMEARESAAQQRLEARMGVEKKCPDCGKPMSQCVCK